MRPIGHARGSARLTIRGAGAACRTQSVRSARGAAEARIGFRLLGASDAVRVRRDEIHDGRRHLQSRQGASYEGAVDWSRIVGELNRNVARAISIDVERLSRVRAVEREGLKPDALDLWRRIRAKVYRTLLRRI